jgi:hypothetical protein
MKTTIACISFAVLAAMPPLPAHAATDRKILHGTICQPENPADAAQLRYTGRGLHALGADVQLVCPIVRDSTLSGLTFLQVRFQRGFGNEVVDFPGRKFRIEFLSCSDKDIGNACRSSGLHASDDGNNPTSAPITTFDGIPMDEDRAFSVKTTLPKGTVLKSITYVEKVK